MTHRAALAVFAALLASPLPARADALGAMAPGPLERGGVPTRLVPGRAILKLKDIDGARLELPRATDAVAIAALSDLGKRRAVELTLVRSMVLGWALVEIRDPAQRRMPSESETEALIERLAGDVAVEAVAADHWWKTLALPNDPGLAQMWHLEAIGAPAAWDVTRGLSSQRIGVVDTGLLRGHEDVGGRAVRGFDFVSSASAANDGNGRDSDFNDAGDSCQGAPSSFHGTHVAGTMGAAANNGKGIAGLNWNAGIVVARVLGRCGGASSDIMEGAAWLAGAQIAGVPAVGADKVSVMNLSLGGANSCSSFEQQVADFVDAQGVVFVAAAGNDGGAVGSPANCNKVIAVSAFGPDNSIASYSSFGSQTKIVGPGGDQRFGSDAGVLSSVGPGAASYSFLQGTSMASPHVAGTVSLLQAVAPGLTRTQIVAALRAGGQSCSGCGGVPMLNIPAALAAVGGTSTPPPAPPPPTGQDDAYEQNDAIGQATNAGCGVDSNTLVAAAGDRDFFVFTPPANRQIAVKISALNGADLDLYVTDGAGTILARSETLTGEERITGTASGARLGIIVNPYSDPNTGVNNAGPYRLTITCGQTAQAAEAEFDAGDAGAPVDEIIEGGELGEPTPEEPIAESGDEEPAQEAPAEQAEPAEQAVLARTLPAPPSADGGCTSSGAQPMAIGLLALAALARVRRRR